jgi:hypothetical protein
MSIPLQSITQEAAAAAAEGVAGASGLLGSMFQIISAYSSMHLSEEKKPK